MVQIDLEANFKCKLLGWDNAIVTMTFPGNFLPQPDLTKHKIQYVVMYTEEPVSKVEYY